MNDNYTEEVFESIKHINEYEIDKIREVSKFRVYGDKLYDLDSDDIAKLKESMLRVFNLQ